jgi:nitrate/nitrite transport system substrate-binding protein
LIRAAHASDAPEVRQIRLGIIAVSSCASIVIAHEKGFFRKHGLESSISKETSWAGVRDKLVSGENHGTHMKYVQPLGCSLGVMGSAKTPMIAPFTLARNGSVFMVDRRFAGKLTFDPMTWKSEAEAMRARGEIFTIALPIPFGWHAMMYRYFLANAGVDADKQFKLITLPPAQMVQNLRVKTMHACAMVEPWGKLGVSQNITSIVMYGNEMWPDHPIKAFGIMEEFANRNPKTVRAMLRALHEAAVWCDDFGNRPELARILSAPTYVNAPEASILAPLMGEFNWGDGRKAMDRAHSLRYNLDNYPQPREAKWHLTQFRRWGWIEGDPDYEAVARRVGRADLYLEAMSELGVTTTRQNDAPIKLWDGKVFDQRESVAFARSFALSHLKG